MFEESSLHPVLEMEAAVSPQNVPKFRPEYAVLLLSNYIFLSAGSVKKMKYLVLCLFTLEFL
jgi:hypothetical protein